MFAEFCLQLTHEVGKHTLLPSPSLDESKRLLPLNVVTMEKKNKYFVPSEIKYSTYDISLKDLLIDQHAPEIRIEKSVYCSYNPESAYSLNGNFEAGMNNVIGANISAYDQSMHTNKLGELLQKKIEYSSFMSALKERKLDMNHHFIREIRDTKQVLCVIARVITTSDKSEIKHTEKTGGNIAVSEKIRGTIVAAANKNKNSGKHMVIEPGTTLAYYVWELRVDIDSGEITPIMMANHSGGFFKNDIRKIEKCSLEKFHCLKVQEKRQSNVKSSRKRSHKHNEENSPPLSNDEKVEASNSQLSVGSLSESSRECSLIDDEKVEASNSQLSVGSLSESSRECSLIDDKDMEPLRKRIGLYLPINVQMKTQRNVKCRGKRSRKHIEGNPPPYSNDKDMEPLRKRIGLYLPINVQKMTQLNVKCRGKTSRQHNEGNSPPHSNVQMKTQLNVKCRGKTSRQHNEGNSPPHSNVQMKTQRNVKCRGKTSRQHNEGNSPPHSNVQKMTQLNVKCRGKTSRQHNEGNPPPHSNDEDGVALTLQELQAILQPLRDCTEADGQHIKSSLLDLMTCYSDAVAMSTILSKAEKGSLNEDKDRLDQQFINNDTMWSILTFVGVKTEEGRVLYESEATPILIAVAYMIDAILELENDDLENIYHFDESQLNTLSKIFESAVAGNVTTSTEVDMSLVLKEPVSSFLTRQKFTVCNDSIQPSKTTTCIVEFIFCVLYCLSRNCASEA